MNNTKNLFKKIFILGVLSLGLILIFSNVYAKGGEGGSAPTAWINADSTSLSYGGSTTIHWGSSNATFCNIFGPNVSYNALSGSADTGSLTSDSTYEILCRSSASQWGADETVSISLAPHPVPTVDIYPAVRDLQSRTGYEADL